MSTPTHLTIPQGTTWGIAWPITESGSPKDITGWTVRAQIRAPGFGHAVLHEWSTTLGNATVAGSAVTLLLTPGVSAGWAWDFGVYDVALTSPAGEVFRIAEGTVYVSPEVTR